MQRKPMFTHLLGVSLAMAGVAAHAAPVHVHLGLLKFNDADIIERKFLVPFASSRGETFPRLERCRDEAVLSTPSIELHCRSSIADVIASLGRADVKSVVFIGHPGLVGEGAERRAFVVTNDKKVVPQALVQAAHAGLSKLYLVSCRPSLLRAAYGNHPSAAKTLVTFEEEAEGSELLHMFVWPAKLAALLEHDLVEHDLASAGRPAVGSESESIGLRLRISHRDLLSTTYTYSVFANDRLVGSLARDTAKPGRLAPSRGASLIHVPADLASAENLELRIAPDFVGRKTVDDIIVDRIERLKPSGEAFTLFDEPAHLGDDEERWDADERLSMGVNAVDFARLKPRSELRVRISTGSGR